MIKLAPSAPLSALQQLFEAFVSWQSPPPPELDAMVQQIVHGYKGSIPPDQWAMFAGAQNEQVRQRLAERYQL